MVFRLDGFRELASRQFSDLPYTVQNTLRAANIVNVQAQLGGVEHKSGHPRSHINTQFVVVNLLCDTAIDDAHT